MAQQKAFTPKDLWNILLDLDQKKISGTMPDIEMLHHAFKDLPERKESIFAKNSFENAMNSWDDAQMRDFFQYISDEKLPAEITSTQLHSGLKILYQKIFGL